MLIDNNQLNIPYIDIVHKSKAGLFIASGSEILFCNDAFSSIFNLNPEDIAQSSIMSYVENQEKEKLKLIIQNLSNTIGASYSGNFQLAAKFGKRQYMSSHLHSYETEDGLVYIVGASRNATDRVTKTKQLIESNTMLESLYKNMVLGIFTYDFANEKVLDCNQLTVDILNYKHKEEVIGLNRFDVLPRFSDYSPNTDFHKVAKEHQRMVQRGESFYIESVFKKSDGEEILITGHIVPTNRKQNEAFIIFNDVTEKYKRIAEKRKIEESYRHVFNNSHEAIIYIDLDSLNPILANQNALDLFGVNSLDELSKLRPDDFVVLDDDEKRSPIDYYKESLEFVLKAHKHYDEVWIATKNKERIRVKITFVLDEYESDSHKIILFIKDVTTLYKAQQELEQKNIELEKYIESNLQLEKFAYFASHDLQTPLRSIISFTQLLERNLAASISEKEQGYMDYIIDSAKNMKDLINDILSFSRVEVDDFELSTFKLQELWDDIIPDFQSDISTHNIQLDMKGFDTTIVADVIKLKQVLTNLLSNAIKFRNKTVPPEISVHCEEQNVNWLFTISDNGIGIDKEFHSQIFMLFKSLHPRSEYKGTGIGLTLVKKLIEGHGGEIWLKSEAGKGTTFYFTLAKPKKTNQ